MAAQQQQQPVQQLTFIAQQPVAYQLVQLGQQLFLQGPVSIVPPAITLQQAIVPSPMLSAIGATGVLSPGQLAWPQQQQQQQQQMGFNPLQPVPQQPSWAANGPQQPMQMQQQHPLHQQVWQWQG